MPISCAHHDALWRGSTRDRLTAARSLSKKGLQDVTRMLLEGCPTDSWPYGCGTSVNPWVIFLGPSPGTSPASGDANYILRVGDPPTAGHPHSAMLYRDSKGFFDRLRVLTIALLRAECADDLSDFDRLALAGMMNLDSGASGEARNVAVKLEFGKWVLELSFRRLRPKYVVGVGLGGFLRRPDNAWLLDAIGGFVGGSFHPDRPARTVPFKGYREKQYAFRLWEAAGHDGEPVRFILLPQHPSRAPMTNTAVWGTAVQEFLNIIASW